MSLDVPSPSSSPSPSPSLSLIQQQQISITTQDRAHSSASRSPEQSSTPTAYLSISGLEDGQVAKLPVLVPTPETEADGLFLTQDIPINKGGFSYIPCAPSPVSSPSLHHPFLRYIPQFADVSIPHLSFSDRSAHLRVSPSALTASSATGFRSGRATTPVRSGSFYCEFTVDRGGGDAPTSHTSSATLDGAHVRLGWGRKEASLNSPVGLDGYSYGVRDKTGEKVTCSRTKKYFEKGFRTGDVVGLWISLPEEGKGKGKEVVWEEGNVPKMVEVHQDPTTDRTDHEQVLEKTVPSSSITDVPAPPIDGSTSSHIVRQRIPIRYKSQLYFETIDPSPTKEMDTLLLPPPKSVAAPVVPTGTTSTSNGKRKKSTRITNKTLPSVDSMRPAIGAQPLRPLPVLKGSKIAFFVNGSSPGYAFTDLFDYRPLPPFPSSIKKTVKSKSTTQTGTGSGLSTGSGGATDDGTLGYYPFLSVYGGGRVTFNPGPDFKFPPPDDIESYLDSQELIRQPESTSTSTSEPASGSMVTVKSELGSKDEPTSAALPDILPNLALTAPMSSRTWLPLSVRYEGYMEEHRALDERDEQTFLKTYVAPEDIPSTANLIRPKVEKRKSSVLVPTVGQMPPGSTGQMPTDEASSHQEHDPMLGSTEAVDKPANSFQGPVKKVYKKSRLGLALSSDDETMNSHPGSHSCSRSPPSSGIPLLSVSQTNLPETTTTTVSMPTTIYPTDVPPHLTEMDPSFIGSTTSSPSSISPSSSYFKRSVLSSQAQSNPAPVSTVSLPPNGTHSHPTEPENTSANINIDTSMVDQTPTIQTDKNLSNSRLGPDSTPDLTSAAEETQADNSNN